MNEDWPGAKDLFSRAWWRSLKRLMADEFAAAWRDATRDVNGEPLGLRLGYRAVVVGLLLLGVAAVVYGLLDDPQGFFGNWVAEVAGITGGAVLAVTLLERVLHRQREEQWRDVRDEIERAICAQVIEMTTSFYRFTGQQGPFLRVVGNDNVTPRTEVADAMVGVTSETEDGVHEFVQDADLDRASSRSLFEDVTPSVAPVRDLMTTRVVVLGNEPELVRRLLHLEREERDWRSWLEAVEEDGAPSALAWGGAVQTLRAGAAVYRYFSEPALG